jgi:hypothetical protein
MGQILRKLFPDAREQTRVMIFGHNSNVKIDNATFHVQTEDRGESHALVDTTVYYQGRVLHRRTNNYFDLLPLDEDRREALKLRLEDQHRTVIEDIRNGNVQIVIPPSASAPQAPAPPGLALREPAIPPERQTLVLELTNAKTWLSGKRANLLLAVREKSGDWVAGAQVRVEFEGAEHPAVHGQTDPHGQAHIEFDVPQISAPVAALVIYAENHSAKGHLRFALRAKPRVA